MSKKILPSRRAATAAAALALAALAALLLAGCGAPSGPGVASIGSTTTTTAPAASVGDSSPSGVVTTRMLQFTQCMRSHGVRDFPEPITQRSAPPFGANSFLGNGPNPNSSPVYETASAACRKYAVATKVTPAGAARVEAEQLKYAHCMRFHGVTNFPDPSSEGGFPNSAGIDTKSPIYKHASSACQRFLFLPRLPAGN
jgi:hypothetical protein